MTRLAPVAMLSAVTLVGCTSADRAPTAGAGAASAGATSVPSAAPRESGTLATTSGSCTTDHKRAPLPEWAREGFFTPAPPMPYVLGDRGEIIAILWADHDPLQVPPPPGRNNKILWVASDGSTDPLTIRATLRPSGETVTRRVADGPGPSIVDLPAPGCWSLDLTWGDHHDHLDLAYAAGAG